MGSLYLVFTCGCGSVLPCAIGYVLLLLQIMSCIHVMEQMGKNRRRCIHFIQFTRNTIRMSDRQYCFARWHLSSSSFVVVCNTAGRQGAARRVGSRPPTGRPTGAWAGKNVSVMIFFVPMGTLKLLQVLTSSAQTATAESFD